MLKKLVLITCAIILLAIAAFPVHAESFSMTVPGQNVLTCPTIMAGEPPLDRYDIPITIYNQHQYPDNYIFTWSLPSGWPDAVFGLTPTSQLASGEEKQVTVFMTVPDVAPGVYPVTIKAESQQTGDFREETFNVQVLSCHALSVSAEPAYQKACIDKDTSVSYEIKVKNSGKSAETFSLEATQNGLNVPYASFSESSLTVPAGSAKSTVLTMTPPQGITGVQEMKVLARSQTSTAKADAGLKLDIGSCYDFTASISPSEREVCLGKAASFSLLIRNDGQTDTYRIITPEWVESSTQYISLPAGQSYTATLTALPEEAGDQPFEVTVRSEITGLTQKVSAKATADSCKELAVIMSPTEKSTCSNVPVSFLVSVKNMGAVQDTVELTSTHGSLSQSKVIIEPGETRDVSLDVDPSGMVGSTDIKVIARSDGASDEATGSLVVESCYSASLSIEPAERVTCPCGNVDYKVTLKNDGKLQDTYTIKFGNITEIASLSPGNEKEYDYTFSIPCDMEGKYEIRATASSDKTGAEAASQLTVKGQEDCWSGTLEMPRSVEVEVYEARAVTVKLRNTGENPSTFELKADGPSWVYMDPEEITLAPGSEGEAYVYLSPPHGTEIGSYEVTVKAASDMAITSFTMTANVVEEASEDAVISQPDVTLSASTEEGDAVTGNVVMLVPMWKTVLVGLITLIIVTILVVRFAVLVKA
jgi:uncharacterized membrane protein